MRLKPWNAVLFAALILALGMFTHPRACQAGFNDDVELTLPPGSENGDPDTGSGNRYWITYIHLPVGSGWTTQARIPRLLRANSRPGFPSRPIAQPRRRVMESKK
jgi:hypothetical protein